MTRAEKRNEKKKYGKDLVTALFFLTSDFPFDTDS